MTKREISALAAAALLAGGVLLAQNHAHKKAGGQSGSESVFNQTTQAMASRRVDMGPHMKMSRLRKASPATPSVPTK